MTNKSEIEKIKLKMQIYCSKKERTLFEVKQKLNKYDIPVKVKNKIIKYLIDYDFINEQRFISSFVHDKFYIQRWGKIKITNEILKKGIKYEDLIKEIDKIPDSDYIATINYLIKKYCKLNKANKIDNKKITNYLLQRGFEHNKIMEVINSKIK